MEALAGATAAIMSSSSSSSPLSIFPSKRSLSPKRVHIPLASRSNENEADLPSGPTDGNNTPIRNGRSLSLSPLSKDAAMGLVVSAAVGRGWTTGSGMEGPPAPVNTGTENISTFPFSLFTKSPRRRMLVAFSCNICQQRTTRAINPHAYSDGTVFVQCCGCNAYHKLVDHLNLFDEMNCYVGPSFKHKSSSMDVKFNFTDDENEDGIFPNQ